MSDTRQNILHHAEQLVRTKGANGFSYADLSAKLGIRKASIHYHFPSKNELLHNLIQSYQSRFMRALDDLDKASSPLAKIEGFVGLYREGLMDDQLCLCGMLTLDSDALTPAMQNELDGFFKETESWLTRVMAEGASEAGWPLSAPNDAEAKAFLAMVQGAQLIARNAEEEVEKFDRIVQPQLTRFG